MRFLYFYLMTDAIDRVRVAAPKHAAYWKELALPEYLGGPFADRSGGLITFEARSATEAEQLVAEDPFVQEDLLERRWVEGWMIDSGISATLTSAAQCVTTLAGRLRLVGRTGPVLGFAAPTPEAFAPRPFAPPREAVRRRVGPVGPSTTGPSTLNVDRVESYDRPIKRR